MMSSSDGGSGDVRSETTATATTSVERVRRFAEGFAAASGSDGLQVFVARVEADGTDSVRVAFDGPDAHLLVGRRGQGLDALQLIAANALRGGAGRGEASGRVRVTCDADNYRGRREETLRQMAMELADEVKSSGQEAVLDPLSPLERRIVHTVLADDPGVTTYSEGEEPDRYIIISPAT